jgi:SagB-type dehydrogenase family enzyme
MKRYKAIMLVITGLVLIGLLTMCFKPKQDKEDMETKKEDSKSITLPKPETDGKVSVEKALNERRSVRTYKDLPLDLKEVSQLLFAAYGITGDRGFKTTPSAGATYPLVVYLVVNNVQGLDKGVYRYIPQGHKVTPIFKGDVKEELTSACLNQGCIKNAAVVIAFAAIFERTTGRYGKRGIMYVHQETGHASENVYLQCVSLNLGTVAVGAFNPEDVHKALHIPDGEEVLYLMPVGKR